MTPALLAQLPRLRYQPAPTRPLVPDREAYPTVAGDLAVLDRELVPVFVRFDQAALRAQNTHRLIRVALILGALAATILGVWATTDPDAVVPGAAGTAVGGVVAALAWVMRKRRYQRRFLHARLTAELLRAEFFRYLARTDRYSGENRDAALRHRVRSIEAEVEV